MSIDDWKSSVIVFVNDRHQCLHSAMIVLNWMSQDDAIDIHLSCFSLQIELDNYNFAPLKT